MWAHPNKDYSNDPQFAIEIGACRKLIPILEGLKVKTSWPQLEASWKGSQHFNTPTTCARELVCTACKRDCSCSHVVALAFVSGGPRAAISFTKRVLPFQSQSGVVDSKSRSLSCSHEPHMASGMWLGASFLSRVMLSNLSQASGAPGSLVKRPDAGPHPRLSDGAGVGGA